MADGFKYRAFISYSHADEAWAKWLHQRLERYRVPSRLVGKSGTQGIIPPRIGRCFRDQAELSAASHLGETLQQALSDSQALIIVCSPRSAASHWVNEEIKLFRSLGRGDQIYALIVDGEPNAKDAVQECFPPALVVDESGQQHEPLAADARSGRDGKVDAFLRLASALIGAGFDELRQREQRRRARLMIVIVAASLVIALTTTGLAISAYHARNEASQRREQADDLINFMLGDLRSQLVGVGRLDVLDSTVTKAMTYLGSAAHDADPATLAQRSEALYAIASIRIDRGQLKEAVQAADQGIDAARQLLRAEQTERAEVDLAKALYMKAQALETSGQFDGVIALATEGLTIVRHLRAGQPPNLEFAWYEGRADLNLAFGEAYGKTRDVEAADQALKDCSNLLRPLVRSENADARLFDALLLCGLNRMGFWGWTDRTHSAKGDFEEDFSVALLADAKLAMQRFPNDARLQGVVVLALSNIGDAFKNYPRSLPQAQEVAGLAIGLGQALLALDTNSTFHIGALAWAYSLDAELKLKAKDWHAARDSSDRALALFGRLRELAPTDTSNRVSEIDCRAARADLMVRSTNNHRAALAEIETGLKVAAQVSGMDDEMLWAVLRLRMRKWRDLAPMDPKSAQANVDAIDQLLQQVSGNGANRLEDRAALAYVHQRIEDGDRFYSALLTNAPAKEFELINELRDTACGFSAGSSATRCEPTSKFITRVRTAAGTRPST